MADFRYEVPAEEDGSEIRVLLRKHFDFSSRLRGRIKRENRVLLNGVPTPGWHKAKAGDVISVDLPDDRSHFEPENIPLDPVYEDDDLLILNKQPSLVVHPTKGHLAGTVANGLMYYMQQTGKPFKIRFINRLDMDTSGLLIVAKNAYAQNEIVQQMKQNKVTKEYAALVCGIISEESGTIDLPIAPPLPGSKRRRVDPEGAPSVTHYQVLERFDGGDHGSFTLVRLRLETGRTHQIRVHMSYIGHPVAGDRLYGGTGDHVPDGDHLPEQDHLPDGTDDQLPGTGFDLIGRQALHAQALTFFHPATKKELHVEAPLPSDMTAAIERLRSMR